MEIVSSEMPFRKNSLFALLIFSSAFTDVRPACADAVETAGDVLQFGIPAIALGMTGYRRDLAGAGYLTGSAVVTGAWVWTLKVTVKEERPSLEAGIAIGLGTSLLITKPWKPDIVVAPLALDGGFGALVAVRF